MVLCLRAPVSASTSRSAHFSGPGYPAPGPHPAPNREAHRVGTLARLFGCAREDAHRADADVEMLGGIVKGLEVLLQEDASGTAVYELLLRAQDPWTALLAPAAASYSTAEILATFARQITPLLPESTPATHSPLDASALDATFTQAEQQGRTRRPAQIEMSQLAIGALRDGGYAIIEAGTGTGKSQGYLIPAALSARSSGRPIAVSTFTRILQSQLVKRELPFIQQLIPEITYTQLQGRANYLSLSRLAEELEDAFSESSLTPARAWMLATLVRFAANSIHGNLEELGMLPQALDSFLNAEGAPLQILASVRSSQDDTPSAAVPHDFYRRARENADRANLVVVNHALLLRNSLGLEDEEVPFGGTVICDEAHTLEDAATTALERRVEERVLRRILRAIHTPQRGGFVSDCLRRLHMPESDPTLQALGKAVDITQAALDNLARRLHTYVNSVAVVASEDMRRYGVRVRIDKNALAMAGGPALRTAYQATEEALKELRATLASLIEQLSVSTEATGAGSATDANRQGYDSKRKRRIQRLARSLQRDLGEHVANFQWFWRFDQSSSYVYIVELEKQEVSRESSQKTEKEHPRASIVISAVPINVGPLLWTHLWSRLDAAIFTSATLTVSGQGFDFFQRRVGLEKERIASAGSSKQLITHTLPHAFNYHEKALLMLPNDLPAPRDSDLKRNFPVAVAELLRRFIPTFAGRSLGLFTANSRRDFVYDAIVDELANKGYPVLRQGQGSLQAPHRPLPRRRPHLTAGYTLTLGRCRRTRTLTLLRLPGETSLPQPG